MNQRHGCVCAYINLYQGNKTSDTDTGSSILANPYPSNGQMIYCIKVIIISNHWSNSKDKSSD